MLFVFNKLMLFINYSLYHGNNEIRVMKYIGKFSEMYVNKIMYNL